MKRACCRRKRGETNTIINKNNKTFRHRNKNNSGFRHNINSKDQKVDEEITVS